MTAKAPYMTREEQRIRYEHWKCIRLEDRSMLHSELCIVSLLREVGLDTE